jgi:hypothetical protein
MKRMTISESEKNRIINMYSPSKGRINEATATELQQLLNDTFKAGLTVDGKLGSKTIAAIENALKGKTATQGGEVGKLPTKPAEQLPTGASLGTQPTTGKDGKDTTAGEGADF